MIGFCLDLDGTLYKGSAPIKYAAEFLAYLQNNNIPHIALTNCPERSQKGVSDRLASMGIYLNEENILTSGMTAARVIKQSGAKSVHVLGSAALESECQKLGLEIKNEADAVLIGHSTDITYTHIKNACKAVLKGAKLYCTNCDNTIPEGDTFIPHTGAIAAAVECATGQKSIYIGKPNGYMLEDAAIMMGCPKECLYMVGDRLDTDISFGLNCGISTCLVLTGTTTIKDVGISDVKPDYIFDDLLHLSKALLEEKYGPMLLKDDRI